MKHRVGPNATIEYDLDSHEWVGTVELEGAEYTMQSVELTQVIFELAEADAVFPDSYEVSNRNGIEQVLIVVPGDSGES